jgi:hypothetical protein
LTTTERKQKKINKQKFNPIFSLDLVWWKMNKYVWNGLKIHIFFIDVQLYWKRKLERTFKIIPSWYKSEIINYDLVNWKFLLYWRKKKIYIIQKINLIHLKLFWFWTMKEMKIISPMLQWSRQLNGWIASILVNCTQFGCLGLSWRVIANGMFWCKQQQQHELQYHAFDVSWKVSFNKIYIANMSCHKEIYLFKYTQNSLDEKHKKDSYLQTVW